MADDLLELRAGLVQLGGPVTYWRRWLAASAQPRRTFEVVWQVVAESGR